MTPQNPLDELKSLAAYGERHAEALPAERVRALGARRRQRRYVGAAAAAALVVAVSGGVIASQGGMLGRPTPNPVATPPVISATPGPARTVTAENLLRVSDIATQTDEQKVVVPGDQRGRSVDRSSACVPDTGLGTLGATAMVSRNFAYQVPGGPASPAPSIYTQALQFPDADAARTALATYRRWVDDCRALLQQRNYTLVNSAPATWVVVETGSRVESAFALVPIYREPGDTSDFGYFESVGLTRVQDRLMITVDLIYGQDANYSTDPGGDPASGLPPHPQFALIKSATERLLG
jgi:hypothetical protein